MRTFRERTRQHNRDYPARGRAISKQINLALQQEMEDVRPQESENPNDVADYILQCHGGDAKSAIEAMQEEIEHLQGQLNLAVTAMGRGYTRGWQPTAER